MQCGRNVRTSLRYLVAGVLLIGFAARADITITEGTNITVDVSAGGDLAMDLIGGESTYFMGGSMGDGKGQPAQSNSISHGCP